MPGDAPLYAKPPSDYKDVEAIAFAYETDAEAVLDILPEGLELPDVPTATVSFVRYPFSTLGMYNEAILGVSCLWQGEPRGYIAHIVCDSLIPIAAGREIWGLPKKFAHVTFEKERDMIWGAMERPTGHRICTGVMRPEVPIDISEMPTRGAGGALALRIIPSPEEGAEPSLVELIEIPTTSVMLGVWQGSGSVHFDSSSLLDPWHKLPVKKMLSATYRRNHMTIEYGRVIKTY